MNNYKKIYIISKLVVIFTIINQILNNMNKTSIFFLIMTFLLLDSFYIVNKKCKDKLIINSSYILTIAIVILNIIENFFDIFKHWDTIMHTTTGFVMVILFIYVFKKIKSNRFFLLLSAFSFSMMIGATWEILEFSYDYLFFKDSQKDRIVTSFKTNLIENNKNTDIENIQYTLIYHKEDGKIKATKIDGYLDIGIIDTMKDLIVNLVGASTALVVSYSYLKNK